MNLTAAGASRLTLSPRWKLGARVRRRSRLAASMRAMILLASHARRGAALAGRVTIVLGHSARAAETWTDISSSLLERLTNSGAKPAWPGGCSGVVMNRTNGDVTIKVVGLGLWRSSDQGRTWRRIDDSAISGRDE